MNTSKARLQHYRSKGIDWRKPYNRKRWGRPEGGITGDGNRYAYKLEHLGNVLGYVAPNSYSKLESNPKRIGWYSDNFQDGAICGAVVQVRSSRGTYYVPCTTSSEWDRNVAYWQHAELVEKGGDHEEAIREAARSADHHAEREAEAAREEDARYQAELQIETARETIHAINAKALAVLRELRTTTVPPAICAALRERLQDMLEERSAAFATIAERQSDYWTAVPSWAR